ncbi:hypothetical protein ACE6H2_015424 [Prunus campanulata]
MCSGFFRAKPHVSMAPLMRWMKRGVEFMGRQWNLFDIASLVVVLSLHLLALLAPVHFSWGALWLAFALYVVTGLGVTLGFHRSLAHRSFKLRRWLEYFFVYCGVLTLQWPKGPLKRRLPLLQLSNQVVERSTQEVTLAIVQSRGRKFHSRGDFCSCPTKWPTSPPKLRRTAPAIVFHPSAQPVHQSGYSCLLRR